MSDSYRALCSDFYVNLKMSVKMDLPRGRETVLELFERVRRDYPAMTQFKRYRDELALETPQGRSPYRWLAIRSSSIRSGVVNPNELSEAYSLHELVLEVTPYFLTVSPLDVEYVELLYGFDLQASGNHDAIVYDALIADSPLGRLLSFPGATPVDCQPVVGASIGSRGGVEAHFEVKTRSRRAIPTDGEGAEDPISVYLTLRRGGATSDLKSLARLLGELSCRGEELVESQVIPNLLAPIRASIVSGA